MMRCQRHETTYSIQSYRKQFRVPKHNQHKRSELVPCQFSTQSIRCVQRRKKRKKEEKKKEKKRRKETNTRERLSTLCGHYVFQSTSKTKSIFLLLSFIVPTQQYIYIYWAGHRIELRCYKSKQ